MMPIFHKYYAPFYRQITTEIYLQEHNIIEKNTEYVVINMLFWICY